MNRIGNVNDFNERKSKLEIERDQMTSEQERIRENIAVLGDTSQENTLREKYVKKLSIQEERYESISAEIEQLEQKIKDMNKQIQDKMNKIRYN